MAIETIHGQKYEYYTWNDLGQYIFTLARVMIEAGEEFDRVVALAKGGLTFARSLVDFLAVDDVSSFQIQFYTDIGETAKMPVITQSLPVSVKDESVLVFDDVIDSGETMNMAKRYLEMHGVKKIVTCGLVQKPWTKFKTDYVAAETDSWVIFPNESRETIELLVKKWTDLGDSPEKIKAQLLQIGFPEPEVALFMNLD